MPLEINDKITVVVPFKTNSTFIKIIKDRNRLAGTDSSKGFSERRILRSFDLRNFLRPRR